MSRSKVLRIEIKDGLPDTPLSQAERSAQLSRGRRRVRGTGWWAAQAALPPAAHGAIFALPVRSRSYQKRRTQARRAVAWFKRTIHTPPPILRYRMKACVGRKNVLCTQKNCLAIICII